MSRSGRATGEGYLAHQRVPGEGCASGRAVTGDDVDHARRNAGFKCQTRQFEHGRRGVFRGFEDDGVASSQCWCQLDGGEVQRAVPGDDPGHHAHRFVHGVGEQVRLVEGQGAAFEFVSQPCGVMKELRQVADLPAGLANQFAVVAAFQLRQLLLVFGNQVAQLTQQLAACRGRQAAPGLTLEGFLGGLNGPFDIGFVSIRQLRPGFGQRRVEAVEGLAGQRIDPLTVDAHLKAGKAHATIPLIEW